MVPRLKKRVVDENERLKKNEADHQRLILFKDQFISNHQDMKTYVLQKHQQTIFSLKKKIAFKKTIEEHKKWNDDLQKDIESFQRKKNDIFNQLEQNEKSIFKLSGELDQINNKESERTLLEKRVEHLEKEISLNSIIIQALNRKNQQNQYCLYRLVLIDKIPVINKYLKKILQNYIQRELRIEIDENNTPQLVSNERNGLYGGAEKLIIDLALKWVLNYVNSSNKSSLMIIDESLSVLDEERRKNIDEVFLFLKSFYNHTLIISHDNFILKTNQFNGRIMVTKDENNKEDAKQNGHFSVLNVCYNL